MADPIPCIAVLDPFGRPQCEFTTNDPAALIEHTEHFGTVSSPDLTWKIRWTKEAHPND